MTEKRALERLHLLEYQQVQDSRTGKAIGYLGDVNREGLRVLTKRPFGIGETVGLKLRYLRVGGDWQTVEVEAESLWQRKDDGAPFHETGFRIVEPDAATLASLGLILEDLRERAGD